MYHYQARSIHQSTSHRFACQYITCFGGVRTSVHIRVRYNDRHEKPKTPGINDAGVSDVFFAFSSFAIPRDRKRRCRDGPRVLKDLPRSFQGSRWPRLTNTWSSYLSTVLDSIHCSMFLAVKKIPSQFKKQHGFTHPLPWYISASADTHFWRHLLRQTGREVTTKPTGRGPTSHTVNWVSTQAIHVQCSEIQLSLIKETVRFCPVSLARPIRDSMHGRRLLDKSPKAQPGQVHLFVLATGRDRNHQLTVFSPRTRQWQYIWSGTTCLQLLLYWEHHAGKMSLRRQISDCSFR